MIKMILIGVVGCLVGLSTGFYYGERYGRTEVYERTIADDYINSVNLNELADLVSEKGNEDQKYAFLDLANEKMHLYFSLGRCSLTDDLPFGPEIRSLISKSEKIARDINPFFACQNISGRECLGIAIPERRRFRPTCSWLEKVFYHALNTERSNNNGGSDSNFTIVD